MKCKELANLYENLSHGLKRINVILNDTDFDIGGLKWGFERLCTQKESILKIIDDPHLFLLRRNLAEKYAYYFVGEFKDGLAEVHLHNGYWGYIRKDGSLLNEDSFTECRDFVNGFAAVRLRNSMYWSLVDTSGNYIKDSSGRIREWTKVGDFHDGVVSGLDIPGSLGFVGRRAYYINENGVELSRNPYVHCGDFVNGFGIVTKANHGLKNFIGKDGLELNEKGYQECYDFCEGVARVRQQPHDNSWNFLRQDGTELNGIKYSGCEDFQDGFAVVAFSDGYMNFVGENGVHLNNEKYIYCSNFVNGIAVVEKSDGSFSYLKKDGNYLSQEQYENCLSFDDGFGRVVRSIPPYGNFSNFINENGELLVKDEKKYKKCHSFKNGFAQVQRLEGSWNFIDKSGAELNLDKYMECGDFQNGIARVRLKSNGRWLFIDENGEKLFNGVSFDGVSDFYKNHAFVKNFDSSSNQSLPWKILYRDGSFSSQGYMEHKEFIFDDGSKIFVMKTKTDVYKGIDFLGRFILNGADLDSIWKTDYSLVSVHNLEIRETYRIDKFGRVIF